MYFVFLLAPGCQKGGSGQGKVGKSTFFLGEAREEECGEKNPRDKGVTQGGQQAALVDLSDESSSGCSLGEDH